MPEIEAITSWERLIHCVACSMKFIAVVQKKVGPEAITEEEREAAKVLVFNEVQLELTDREKERYSGFQD